MQTVCGLNTLDMPEVRVDAGDGVAGDSRDNSSRCASKDGVVVSVPVLCS